MDGQRNSFFCAVHTEMLLERISYFDSKTGCMGLLADKLELAQVYSEYFGFPCQLTISSSS
jgi:hypothetical protein